MIFNSFQFPKWKAHLFKSAVRTKNLNRFKWNIIDFHLKSHQNMIIQISISKKKKNTNAHHLFFCRWNKQFVFYFKSNHFSIRNIHHFIFHHHSENPSTLFNSFLISKKKKKLNWIKWIENRFQQRLIDTFILQSHQNMVFNFQKF